MLFWQSILKLKLNIKLALVLLILISGSTVAGMDITNRTNDHPVSDKEIAKDFNLSQVPQPGQMNSQLKPQLLSFPKDHPMNDYSDVLLVVNDNSTISKQIGDYFRSQRNIPDKNVCNITVLDDELIYRSEFNKIRTQVEDYITDNNLTFKINYIVTTKGVPLRIRNQPDTSSRRASVDSELCLILGLYSNYIDNSTHTKISQHNYYQKEVDFSKAQFHIYLVTRLTGYNLSDVKQLIDNAAASSGLRGGFLFDRDMSSNKANTPWRAGNDRMLSAYNLLAGKGYTAIIDSTQTFRTEQSNLAGYCSWGRRDNYYYTTPVQNSGLNSPNNEAVNVPSNWVYENTHISSFITRNVTINRSARFSVRIAHGVNDPGYTSVSQNVTVKAGIKYYLTGYVNLENVANFDSGGAFLQIKAYNGLDVLVWEKNGTRRYGDSGGDWWSLYTVPYDPIPGVTKLKVSTVFSKASGTVYFDDISLYEIKPKNTYVPGAIAEVYGYYTALYLTPYRYYPFTIGDFISDGITGIKGYVNYAGESYIYYMAHPDILFDRYTEGFNLAESFYSASPYMSWVDVVIGDPKTAPYFTTLPDATLAVENITFFKEYPNQGETIRINATIENRGGRALNNLKVSFRVGDDLEAAEVITTDIIPSIPAGEFRTSSINWENTEEFNGTQTIWVWADHLNEEREQNESNNYNSNQIFINSFPYDIDLRSSSDKIYRGEAMELYLNVSDIETPENQLNCSVLYNHSSLIAWTPFTDISYETDHWLIRFETYANTVTGGYDVKVIATDQNNATIVLVKKNRFEVLNNPPLLGALEIYRDTIFRTENLTINFTAVDFEDEVTANMISVYLNLSGTEKDWVELNGTLKYFQTSGLWQFNFISNKTILPARYNLKVSLVDFDVEETVIEEFNFVDIRNNPPVIERIRLGQTSVYRHNNVMIFVYGSDLETPQTNMILDLKYRLAIENVPWSNITDAQWNPTTSYWEVPFYINPELLTGNYTLKARIRDSDLEWTDFLVSETEVKVLNNPPTAMHDFEDKVYLAIEDEKIMFNADNSTDIEDGKCTGYLWDFADGITSDEVKTIHSYSKMGEYKVLLTVYDKNLASNTTTMTIKIRNMSPTVISEVNRIQAQINEPIFFDGSKSYDTKSDLVNLSYLWDFDDGTTSNLSKVNHSFNESRTFTVTLIVTDDNDISDSTTIYITIEPKPITTDEADRTWMSDFVFILIMVIVIIIILIIVGAAVWMLRRKRKATGSSSSAGIEIKAKVTKKPIETVEAEIIETPGFVAGATAGKTQTKKSKKVISPTSSDVKLDAIPEGEATTVLSGLEPASPALPTTLGTIPPTDGEDTIIPEIEVEFVPKLPRQPTKAVTTAEPASADEPGAVDLERESDMDFEIDEEIKYPLPATVDSPSAEEDIDFVPPKIDLPTLPEQEMGPEQRPEVLEAQKRGEGISLDFKPPDKKKK